MANIQQLETLVKELNTRIKTLRAEKWDLELLIDSGYLRIKATLTTEEIHHIGGAGS